MPMRVAESPIERLNRRVVTERVIESHVANARNDLRMTDWLRALRAELVARGEGYRSNRAPLPEL